jgi:hypothetical protein
MVHTMPALMPENNKARAKTVPASGERVVVRRWWMVKRSAFSGLEEGSLGEGE